jgi:hypothetical protein
MPKTKVRKSMTRKSRVRKSLRTKRGGGPKSVTHNKVPVSSLRSDNISDDDISDEEIDQFLYEQNRSNFGSFTRADARDYLKLKLYIKLKDQETKAAALRAKNIL